MIRRGLFLLIATLLLLVVWAVRGFDPANRPTHEIIAYEVREGQGVEVLLHGGVTDVSISCWLIIPFSEPGTGPFPYALNVEFFNSDGLRVHARKYEINGRLPQPGDAPVGPRARLSDGSASVSEQRILHLDATILQGRAGRLRVTPAEAEQSHVLLRLAHRVTRSVFEQQLMARTLSGPARAKLIGERTSLGYFDIPASIRSEALSYWQRRLSASGREGRDYFVRRLLLEDEQQASTLDAWNGRRLLATPQRGLVYNFSAGASLRVRSRTATRLWLSTTSSKQASFHDIEAGAMIKLELEDQGLSSAVLTADPEAELSVSTSIDMAQHFLNGDSFSLLHGRLEVLPDFRELSGYVLDEDEPVISSFAPRQQELGLTFRLLNPRINANHDHNPRVLFWDNMGQVVSQSQLNLRFSESAFDEVFGAPVSAPTSIRLHRPEKAVSVAVYGSSQVLVVPFVTDPDFDELNYRAPYNVVLPEALRFRYAPQLLPRRAVLRPDNLVQLREQDKVMRITAQVRLETRNEANPRIAPRVLQPTGTAQRRFLFAPSTYSPRYPFPDNGWAMLSSQRPQRNLRPLSDRQPVLLSYRADPAALGHPWSISVDSEQLLSETVNLLSGNRRIVIPPAGGLLKLAGLGNGGLVVARAKPQGGGRFLKRQQVYHLPPGQQLHFQFNRKKRELLTLAIGVLTTHGNAPVHLEHQIDSGIRPAELLHYMIRPTEWRGNHRTRTGNRGRALLWSKPEQPPTESLPDRLGGVYVAMGDDLPPGSHELFIRNLSRDISSTRNQMWIRAVLVGRALASQ